MMPTAPPPTTAESLLSLTTPEGTWEVRISSKPGTFVTLTTPDGKQHELRPPNAMQLGKALFDTGKMGSDRDTACSPPPPPPPPDADGWVQLVAHGHPMGLPWGVGRR